MECLCLLFLWTLLLLPMAGIYKQPLIFRLCCIMMKDVPHKGPLRRFINICKKYIVYIFLANGIAKDPVEMNK